TNINVIRSMKGALARRMALRAPYQEKLKQVETEYDELNSLHEEDHPKLLELKEEIHRLKTKINAIPFIDTFDLRYNNRVKEPSPTTRAVMFCLMDVSGSMNEERKDIAKRFFILLYLFLTRTYENIDVVFIRHHTTAKEVDEQEFFYSRETGGTVVSSALELMYEIIADRYPTSDWNIYAAQASDGDNWEGDSPACREILVNKIMPCLQYYAYVEITAYEHQSLWREYEKVREYFGNFAIQDIAGLTSIYPVFRELFKKHEA
ncbi:YeaH/YhbH family protein, partial [Kaarinaea lacus]